jgi:hypothetical protein
VLRRFVGRERAPALVALIRGRPWFVPVLLVADI